jgi:scyllo-inositol 2-dehydrogenase (NADP+)
MKVINTAICSFGMSGWVFHAPFISANPGFNFYGVWERTKNLAQEKYPKVITFRTLEDLLADKNVELVIVNTPSVTHYDYARQALLAGKHVIVEKPFTATVAQAQELIDLAATQGKMLSVFQNRRYDSDFKTVKKILDQKLLGNMVDCELHYDRFVPELSYKTHKETPTGAVGSIYDLGSHLIDQALQLFGMPHSLYADIAHNRPNTQVDDYFDIKLLYQNHRVSCKCSYYVREALPGYIFHGTLGSFIKTKGDVQETQLQQHMSPADDKYGIEAEADRGLLHTEIDGKTVKELVPSENGNYADYYKAIYNTLANNAPLPVTALQGLNVIKIIEAAYKSHAEQKVISL